MEYAVMIIDDLKGAGAEHATVRLASLLIDSGIPTSIIVLKNAVEIELDSRIDLHCLDFRKKGVSFLNHRVYAKKLLDVLHGIEKRYFGKGLIVGHLGLSHRLMDLAGLKDAYYTLHGTTSQAKLAKKGRIKAYFKLQELRRLYRGKNLITVSKGVAEDILSLGIEPKTIRTIYNPFDYELIRRLSEQEIDFDFPQSPYIVHVGRFSRVKRHDVLISAFASLRDLNVTLVLVGRGEEENTIRNLVSSLGLETKVVFAGFWENPFPIIKRAKALVLASDNEGLPTVIIEALALGVPVVSTDCPSGPREILSPWMESNLAQVGDAESLAKAMRKVLVARQSIDNAMIAPYALQSVLEDYKNL